MQNCPTSTFRRRSAHLGFDRSGLVTSMLDGEAVTLWLDSTWEATPAMIFPRFRNETGGGLSRSRRSATTRPDHAAKGRARSRSQTRLEMPQSELVLGPRRTPKPFSRPLAAADRRSTSRACFAYAPPSTPYAPQLCQKQSHDPLPQSRTPHRIHDQAVSNALTRSVSRAGSTMSRSSSRSAPATA